MDLNTSRPFFLLGWFMVDFLFGKDMKKYNSRLYDYIDQALEDCNNHQDWNVINIYPTGWRQEKLCVVYYTTK